MDSIMIIRKQVERLVGRQVQLTTELGRKKKQTVHGVLLAAYPNVFTVCFVCCGAERRLTYTYNDVLTRQVRFVKLPDAQ